ncbi:MAG: IMP dehydrogenase, partial [Candidatus Aenigmatarchaeota archaeon]
AKLAFIHQYDGYYVGGAIHTYPGWEKRVQNLIESGADMIFIDTSDARSRFVLDVIEKFKKKYPNIPLCAGNIVSGEGYKELVEAGADLVKVGMGSGSACITSEKRGVGRGLLTALVDVYETKEKMKEEYRKPIIADGGIGVRLIGEKKIGNMIARIYEPSPGSFSKALMFADACMCGTFANMLTEAAGKRVEFEGKYYKERWGEGSFKGISMARYGIEEGVKKNLLVEEGVADLVNEIGRLKPNLEKIFFAVALTIGNNVGARNLEEYREKATYELLSPNAWKKTGVGSLTSI